MPKAHTGQNMPGSTVLLLALNSGTSLGRCMSQEKVSLSPLRRDGRACRAVMLENWLLIHQGFLSELKCYFTFPTLHGPAWNSPNLTRFIIC